MAVFTKIEKLAQTQTNCYKMIKIGFYDSS